MNAIDQAVTAFVQRWIADPLQFGGICLDWQVRGASAVVLAGWLWGAYLDVIDRYWLGVALKGLMIPVALHNLIYDIDPGTKLMIRKESFMSLLLLVMWLVGLPSLLTLDPRTFAIELLFLGLTLRSYLVKCRPKPPAGNMRAVLRLEGSM